MIHSFLKSKIGLKVRKILEFKNFKLENRHLGEQCYIFGDGHSIKYYDMSNFSDKIGIACNHFPFHKDFKKANVKYSVLIEPYYFMPFFDRIFKKRKVQSIFSFNPISFNYRKLIKSNRSIVFFVNLSNWLFLSGKNVHFLYRNILSKKKKYNNEICKKFDCDKGVLRRAISLAVHLGFKEIYLVGCDYLFSPMLYGHWYEKGGPHEDFIDENYIQNFIDEVKKLGINFKIVAPYKTDSNIKVETYLDLFNKDVVYRENTELLTKQTIKFLDMQGTMNL